MCVKMTYVHIVGFLSIPISHERLFLLWRLIQDQQLTSIFRLSLFFVKWGVGAFLIVGDTWAYVKGVKWPGDGYRQPQAASE